jgi:C4-dicarboxylate transporter, DctM subunit
MLLICESPRARQVLRRRERANRMTLAGLVPALVVVAQAYGIDPIHFGIIFLAAMEVGYLCPPAGLNLYFASAMFNKSLRVVAVSVLPAMGAIFVGTMAIALLPVLSTGLPQLLGGR